MLNSLLFPLSSADLPGKTASQQRLPAVEQALAGVPAETATAWQLLAWGLAEASEGVLLVDNTQCVRLLNASLVQLFGLPAPATELVGQPARLAEAHLRQRLATPTALDLLFDHPAAGYVPLPLQSGQVVEVKVLPLPVAAGRGYLLRSRAGTGPASAPAGLSLAFVSGVLDTLPVVVLVRDTQGAVLFKNQAANTLLRQCQAGPQLAQADAATLSAPMAGLDAELRRASRILTSETSMTLNSGEVRWFQTVTCPLTGPLGEVLVLSIGTDITARVATEQASPRAREAAEAAVQAKEAFLASMSHEIRTPLNGVLGMADQLAKTPLDTQQQHLLHIVRTSGHFLLEVLNDVLDMSKIASGKLELVQAPLEFCQLASEALALLAWQATDKGLDFACAPLGQSAPFPLVLGDGHRLGQVLVNLVGNALKFTSQGYVHVRSQVLAQTDDALTLQVAVADSGIGIAADKHEVIFEFFTQASPDIQRQYGGSGLGLSLCRALVQHMGGTLTVASQPGVGSTFTVELTLPKAVPTLRPAPLATPPTQGNSLAGLRVLLVDDNEINRSVARFQLVHWGTVLHEASSGPTALAMLAAQPFDVVLLDIQMPGMNGLEVLAELRRHPDPQRAATPAIAFTANAFRADTERYLAAGFASYLAKPFAEQDLYQQLVPYCPPAPAGLFDLTYLHTQAQGTQALITKVINSFLRTTPAQLLELRAAADAGNWEAVTRLVHHLRSNVQVLGIRQAEACLVALQPPLPPASGPAAEAFARATHSLADCLEAALRALLDYLP